MANMTVGDLRQLMAKAKATWTINESLKDTDPLPQHPTGADLTKVPNVANVPRVDISTLLGTDTANPYLRQLRINRGTLKPANVTPAITALKASTAVDGITAITPSVVGGAGTAASVDWRNRFGWPWLTNIKDQEQCESCWCFGATGTVEAMTRIEHTIWSLRSEGDVHDGMGYKCDQGGDPGTALNWIQSNGVADPGCWPYETSNLPYKPTSDRDGRTVKIDNYTTLSNIDDQKAWIDQNGPLAACFTCYWDFQAYGPNSGVYICNPASGVDGGHCIIIVGYDDTKKAWLIRNSWGTGWGMAGYCWFGYGQCGIDSNVKYGVLGSSTNPDPWTKRRAHNGNLYESGDGAIHRNFEVWALAPGNAIRHYWRDGNTLQWSVAETQANDCVASPTVTGTTYNRNFEMVYPTTTGRLHHRYFQQSNGQWYDGGVFGPTNVAGIPGFIQSSFGAPGNFEVVVRLANGTLTHWYRNEAAGGVWSQTAVFGSNIALSAPTLSQRWDGGLELVCVNNDGTMQRWCREQPQGSWVAYEKFGTNVKSAPVMIRSQFGATTEVTPGNYELCVVVDGMIQHWWTPGEAAANWTKSATFGTNVANDKVEAVLGLIQSSFGFDLEVVALLTCGDLQHFWRDGAGWHAGVVFGTSPIPAAEFAESAVEASAK